MKLFAFGDSFVMGDQDDFIEENKWITPPTHGMNKQDRVQYLRHNVSFISHVARELDCELENYAVGGSGNQAQLDRLYTLALSGKIQPGDTVFFGLTTAWRDRMSVKLGVERHIGQLLNFADPALANKPDDLVRRDYLYTNILLSQICKQYQVRLIAVNLFDNQASGPARFFEHVMGFAFEQNTLIDVLNDTWGGNVRSGYAGQVPAGFEHLYTVTKPEYPPHPSIEGHVKIANWLTSRIL